MAVNIQFMFIMFVIVGNANTQAILSTKTRKNIFKLGGRAENDCFGVDKQQSGVSKGGGRLTETERSTCAVACLTTCLYKRNNVTVEQTNENKKKIYFFSCLNKFHK